MLANPVFGVVIRHQDVQQVLFIPGVHVQLYLVIMLKVQL